MTIDTEAIITTILSHFPDTQAIYLFGSCGTDREWPDSDVDIALLFPVATAKAADTLFLSECQYKLKELLHKEIDLINLRTVSTVFQKEIIFTGTVLFCQDANAREEFEMLVISFYQKLNEERKEILDSFYETKRAYPV